MIRVAHLSDTHLGYRQYNLEEREQDIYDVLDEIADKILDERVDIVIHSGDLFDSWRPTTQAYYAFKSFLGKLKGKPKVLTILGDHDSPKRRGMAPHMLFDDKIEILGLNEASHHVLNLNGQDVLVAGISHLSRRYRNLLTDELGKLDTLAANFKFSILTLHQSIDKFFPFEDAFELKLEDVPKNFSYYAIGHLHNRVRASHGVGELGYSGSTEILRKNEISGWEKAKKGFYVVDVDSDEVNVAEVNLDRIRPQIAKKISYSHFDTELENLLGSSEECAKPPIIHALIEGKHIDRQAVHQALTDLLAGKCLQIRPEFIEDIDKKILEVKPGSFNPTAILKEYLQEEKISELGVELFKFLRIGDMDEARRVADEYFKKWEAQ